ncbi:MAG: DUF433 domain-containing protein [Actinomycetales bacterium]
MSATAASVQRSFRLSGKTSHLLDSLAEIEDQSRNAIVERLLAESLRTYRHPMIQFRTGASGRREPGLAGTRLLVRQVVAQVRAEAGDVVAVADYLDQPLSLIEAAIAYYADNTDEIDTDAAWAARADTDARARWERQQSVFT